MRQFIAQPALLLDDFLITGSVKMLWLFAMGYNPPPRVMPAFVGDVSADCRMRALVRHLQHRHNNPLRQGEKPTDLDRAISWHTSTAVTLMQAFLLAAETYDSAAIELALPTQALRLYAP